MGVSNRSLVFRTVGVYIGVLAMGTLEELVQVYKAGPLVENEHRTRSWYDLGFDDLQRSVFGFSWSDLHPTVSVLTSGAVLALFIVAAICCLTVERTGERLISIGFLVWFLFAASSPGSSRDPWLPFLPPLGFVFGLQASSREAPPPPRYWWKRLRERAGQSPAM